MSRFLTRRLYRRPTARLGVLRLEDRTVPALFTAGTPQNLGVSSANYGHVVAADLNADGKSDIVVTNYGTDGANAGTSPGQTVGVMLGDGAGGFGTPTTYSCGSNQYVSYSAVGDVTGDGIPDIVAVSSTATSQSGNLTVFKGGSIGGVPTGTYTKFSQVATGGGNSSWVGLADLTGDGKLDAVVCSFGKEDTAGNTLTGNNVTVLQGDGAGNFSLITTVTNGLAFIPTAVAIGDFDGDGKPDLACTVPGVPADTGDDQPNGTVQLLTGNGAGGFTVGASFDSGGKLPIAITAADLNADSKPDLVITNAGNPDQNNLYAGFGAGTAVGVALNAGGSFTAPTVLTAGLNSGGSTSAFASVVADLDGDGKPDIATITYGHPLNGTDARVAVFAGAGNGTFTSDPNSPYDSLITDGQFLALGKFYGATSQDLVVVGATNKINTLKNTTVAPVTTTTALTTSNNTAPYGTNITFTATVTGGVPDGGTVSYLDNGVQIGTGTLTAGTATYSTTTLSVGTHPITAKYLGATGFTPSTSSAVSQQITQAATATALVISPTTATAGDPVTFTVTVSSAGGTPTGTVTLSDGGTQLGGTLTLTAGVATYSTSSLSVGTHIVTAKYAGSTSYGGSDSPAKSVTINAATPTTVDPTISLKSSANPSTFGGSVTFTSTVTSTSGTPTGSITFYDGATALSGAVALANTPPTATFALSSLAVGTHTVTAKYSGGPGFNPATSGAVSQVVSPIATSVGIATDKNPGTVSLPVTFTATVTAASGSPVGSVQFYDGAVALSGLVPLGAGSQATFAAAGLSIGSHDITAKFVPTVTDYASSTSPNLPQSIQKAGVGIGLASSGAALVSQEVTLTATLTETPTIAADPTGSVTFKLDGTTIGTAAISGGSAVFKTTTLPVGGGTVTAEYAGDTNFQSAASGGVSQSVSKGGVTVNLQGSTPGTVGSTFVFVATVGENPTLVPDPSGSVTFSVNGKAAATVTLSGGSATFSTSSLPVGTASVTADYSGDANFLAGSGGPVSQQVLAIQSAVGLATSGTPATVSQAVTLTATVTTATGTPAGTVTFFSDGTAVSPPVALAGGKATFSTAALPVGTSNLTAQFASTDPNVTGSTSAALAQTVQKAAATVTVSVAAVTAGKPTTVTVGVTKPYGLGVDPGGTVTLRVNGTAVGSAPVVGGVATFSTTLPTGDNSVTAEFGGDGNYASGSASTTANGGSSGGGGSGGVNPGLVGYKQFGVGAGAGRASDARFFNPDGTERFTASNLFGGTGGVRVTSADFNGDGVADLVAGTGPGSASQVVVLDGVTRAQLFAVSPFEASFTGGVYVATGDVNGDGVPDLIISPDEGGGPRVRVFSGKGFTQIDDFFGIDDPNFRGGARAAVGDVNGDGVGDLVVAAGFGGGPRVAIFDGTGLGGARPKLVPDFFVFEQGLRNGAFVAVGDVDGDGKADLIAGGGPGGGPRVTITSGAARLQGNEVVLANFFAGDPNNRGGVRVVARDLDNDGQADLVVGSGTGAGSRVTAYTGKAIMANPSAPAEQFAFDAFPGFDGGVYVG